MKSLYQVEIKATSVTFTVNHCAAEVLLRLLLINNQLFLATPLGQMPVLEIDGQKYAQSLAIARYLGREFGLAGNSTQEDLEIDQNVYFVNDIRQGNRDST